MKKTNETNAEERFYKKCAEILGGSHDYHEKVIFTRINRVTGEQYEADRSRWGPRDPGNGRYPGFGIIRRFGPTYIHVVLTHPVRYNNVFHTEDEVYKYLMSLGLPHD